MHTSSIFAVQSRRCHDTRRANTTAMISNREATLHSPSLVYVTCVARAVHVAIDGYISDHSQDHDFLARRSSHVHAISAQRIRTQICTRGAGRMPYSSEDQ